MTYGSKVGQKPISGVHRTPDECFATLDDYPFTPYYIKIDGLRMHYVDEGTGES